MNFSGDCGISSAPIETFAIIGVQQLTAKRRIIGARVIRIQPMRIEVTPAIKTQFKIAIVGFDPEAVLVTEVNRLTIGNADMSQCHQA